jgi:UDP-glucose 4-epimerase
VPKDELSYLLNQRLKNIGPHIHYKTDIRDKQTIDSILFSAQPDIVVHMASFPRQKVVNVDPSLGAEVMMCGLINLLESCKRTPIKRFVYISSSMVYGDFNDQVTEEAVCNPQGQYAIMKLAGEWLVRDYAKKYGWEFVIIRPSAVYGPLDVEDRVVAKFMINAMKNKPLKVNGVNETLDFTYVQDAANGIVLSTEKTTAANNIFNITKSHSVTLHRAAEMIVQIVGQGTIVIADKDQDFPSRGALNIDKARNLLGFDPKVDVDQGFVAYYKWLSESTFWQEKLAT